MRTKVDGMSYQRPFLVVVGHGTISFGSLVSLSHHPFAHEVTILVRPETLVIRVVSFIVCIASLSQWEGQRIKIGYRFLYLFSLYH